MLTVFTSLACYSGAPLTATETRLAWAGIGEDCRPRTTWRPLTLFGQPGSSSFATRWRFLPRRLRRYHGTMLIHPSSPACATTRRTERRSHTRRLGTLASPPPPVSGTPLGTPFPLATTAFQTFVMKYCPTSTIRINPASLQNLLTLLSGESDSIRSMYCCHRI